MIRAMLRIAMPRPALLIALLLLAAPLRAQPAAPFDASLQRLSEILGALQYLRGICGANEGQKWRNGFLMILTL